MARVRSSLLAAVALVSGAACEPSEPEPRPVAPAEIEVTPAALFPLSIGDRWRERIDDGPTRTRGVTAHTLEGAAVIFGQGDRRPAFYRADEREAALIDPSGRVLEPLLRAPIRAGARFEYALGDGEGAAACEASVIETGAREPIAGTTVGGCVRVERRCVHPPGIVFEQETTRTVEETYCPRIGRVRTRQTIDPPLRGAAGVQAVELVAFRVAGAPRPPAPEAFGCDDVLLLPSDVQAACGPEWTFAGEDQLESGCVHRFTRRVAGEDEGVLELRVSRRPDARAAEAALDTLLPGEPAEVRTREHEGSTSLGATEGDRVVLVQTRGCERERAARLVPFVRSLVAL